MSQSPSSASISSLEEIYFESGNWNEATRKRVWKDWNLCQQCEKLLIGAPLHGGSLTVHHAGPDYYRISGCSFCQVLSEIIDWDIQRLGEYISKESIKQIQITHIDGSHIRMDSAIKDLENNWITLQFVPESGFSRHSLYDSPPWPTGTMINNPPLSSGMVSFLRKRLHECVSNHPTNCQQLRTAGDTDWPARMLEIKGGLVGLRDFRLETMSGQYAALSYCWGDKSDLELHPPFTTIRTNILDLQESGRAISKLPLTIQQALWVCKLLDIEYIWIDSLCIVQDYHQDWERKATKMETVYAMSKVTIIAASSTSCHSGFLDVRLCYSNLTAPPMSPFQLNAHLQCQSGFHHKRGRGYGFDPDPIDTRGWTLQEEILSSRYIRFTEDDVQWRCNTNKSCMCGQRSYSISANFWQNEAKLDDRDRDEAWQDFTKEVSRRNFTKDTDKLVAISSVAKKAAAKFTTTERAGYIAGLWSCDFVAQLGWYCRSGRMTDAYVAPSFSWASLNFGGEGIEYMWPFKLKLCQFRNGSIAPSLEGNVFGSVSAGSATVCGPVIRATILFPPPEPDCFFLNNSKPEFATVVSFDCPVSEKLHPGGYKTLQRSRKKSTDAVGEYSVIVLMLGTSTSGGLEGLVLGRRDDQNYQRLGNAASSKNFEYSDDEVFEMLKQAREEVTIV